MFITRLKADAGQQVRYRSEEFFFQALGARSASGALVTPTAALGLPTVWSCVNYLAKTFAVLPLQLFEPPADGRRRGKRVARHWLLNLFNRRPNQFQSPFEFAMMLEGHLALRGNAFCQISGNNKGEITDLLPLHPDRMQMELLPNGSYRYRYRDQSGKEIIYLRSEIWHLRGLSSDGLVGMSPIELAREAIGESLAMQSYAARFFANDAKPGGGWIEYPGSFADKATKQKFRDSWQELQGGTNRGKVAVLERGMKFHELGWNNADMQFVESRGKNIPILAAIWGVPPHKVGDLSRCMPADTLVYSAEGPKRISEVKTGDRVWSPTATGPELCEVTNHLDNGVREVLEIRTTNRTVRCTGNHRLLVRRAFDRPLNPGEVGGRNVNGEKKRVVWRNEYVAADQLRPGDTLVTLECLPTQGRSVTPTGRPLTVGFMEFCGLLVADGNVIYRDGKPTHVSISRGEHATYMEHYREVMSAEFSRCGAGGRHAATSPLRAEITLVENLRSTAFASVVDAKALADLGLSGTAFTKRVPGWVFEASEEYRLAFLRGFLDGDGTVDGKGRITYYSANKDLLDDIRHLCMGAGVPVTNTRSDLNGKRAFGQGTRMWRFTCSDAGANSRIGSHDTRYIERFASGKAFGRKDRAYPRFGGKDFAAPGLALSRICSIEAKAAEPVFDIEVKGEHCFFADGVASHNSTNNNIEHQSLEYISDTMLPLSKLWASSQEFFLLGPDSELNAEYDMTPLMLSDSDSRAKYYASRTQWGSMTPNEVREREGDDTLPGLDRPLLPLNMVPVNEDGSVPAPQPKLPAPAPAPDGGNARMALLLHGNAERMARRIAAGNLPTAEVLAEALAIDPAAAEAWLQQGWADVPEDQITASLVALGA